MPRETSRNQSKLLLGAVLLFAVCTGWLAAAQDGGAPQPGPVLTIKAGTKLMLNLDTPLNTATARPEDVVWFTARDDVKVNGKVALPRGTPIRGSVIAVKPAIVNGKNQRTELRIRLEEVPLGEGGGFAIAAQVLKIEGEKANGAVNAQSTVGSATQGAMLGGMIGQSAKAAGIGAIGAVAVTIIGGALQGRGPTSDIDLPGGSLFEAKLERALNIPDPTLLAKAVPASPSSAPAGPHGATDGTSPDGAPVVTGDSPIVVAGIPTDAPESKDTAAAQPVPTFEPIAAGDPAATTDRAEANVEPGNRPSLPTAVPATLSVDVNLVQVDAVVRDRAGRPMSNLRQEDFRVLEDGVEQRIQFFSRDQLPLAVALVIDRSGSVAPLMNEVQNAAYQALRLLKNGDEVALFSFAGSVELLEELTTDRQRVANRIGRIQAGGGTAIVDAVSEALHYLDATAPDSRRAVVLISDNAEGRSTATVNNAVSFALESEAVIYSVKVGVGGGGTGILGLPGIPGISRIPGLSGDDPVKILTKESGGEIFDATGSGSISAALTSAIDRLKIRYTLSYSPGNGASARPVRGGYHRIQVQLVSRFGRPDTDYTIHSRSGYYDQQSKQPVNRFASTSP